MSDQAIVYQIDRADRIVAVNAAWSAFAVDNQAPALDESGLLRRSLWDFLRDRATRELYRMILNGVRENRRPVKIPFRCDSPECRRYMEVEILPLNDEGVEFRSSLLKLESRRPVEILRTDTPRSTYFLFICSICKKVKLQADQWAEVEKALVFHNIFADALWPILLNSICPACHAEIRQLCRVMQQNAHRIRQSIRQAHAGGPIKTFR